MRPRRSWSAFATLLLLAAVGCASTSATSSTSPPVGGASGSGGSGGSVCTPGMDQTCNDNPEISSLHGTCLADGTCDCKSSFEKNTATGRCK